MAGPSSLRCILPQEYRRIMVGRCCWVRVPRLCIQTQAEALLQCIEHLEACAGLGRSQAHGRTEQPCYIQYQHTALHACTTLFSSVPCFGSNYLKVLWCTDRTVEALLQALVIRFAALLVCKSILFRF